MHTFHVFSSLSLLLAGSQAQKMFTMKPENHPKLPTQVCTKGKGCVKQDTSIVLDSNWRWCHDQSGSNCYTGNKWNEQYCKDSKSCTEKCGLDGAGDYESTYGISVKGDALTMKFVTQGQQKNVGARVYLLAPNSDDKYNLFKLKNKEFTFDVDVSGLPCGINGALYFTEMEEDGGKSKYKTNECGAKYGTGYGDGQCTHDLKWVHGEANCENWVPSPSDPNAGTGKYGACANEMDIWEANKISAAYTSHVCDEKVKGIYRCEGKECGDSPANRHGGICDKDGCDFNSYRLGNDSYYGERKIVDTNTKFTVVTQFVTVDGTPKTPLKEVRRKYLQHGKEIANSKTNIHGLAPYDSITDPFCADQKRILGDPNDFGKKGGLPRAGDALDRGMVLALSLWDDHTANMQWLDGAYPPGAPEDKPGVKRGTCPRDGGKPEQVEQQFANARVIYSNIRSGDLDSTHRP
ncbi:cellobiohydrolase I [Phyllosticta citriasiana]|uniref:Glucanase n=1 Tax=Phyllosticta citriasiana TaxID=595635 RepID=A0ABR1KKY8_9PEZI